MKATGAVRSRAVARLLGSTVLSQALLSGSNFLVAFVLLRRLGAEPYGYYVLVNVTFLLLIGLQNGFFLPPIVLSALSHSGLRERQSLVGGLLRTRQRLSLWLAGVALAMTVLAWMGGLLTSSVAWLVIAGVLAGIAYLKREFCKLILLAHQRTGDVLRGDVTYVLLLIAGAVSATFLPMATVFAVVGIGAAAWVSGIFMARALWRFEPWDVEGSATVLRTIAGQGVWGVFGSAVHWSFSQGYTYLVAALLDVKAVAALAATRLFLMPINMLSLGIGQSMYPMVARWNGEVSLSVIFRRIMKICAILTVSSLAYAIAVWWARDWLFEVVTHQSFHQGEHLLILWGVAFILMLLRDQLGVILYLRLSLRTMSQMTFVSAGLALVTIWLAIPAVGPSGALIGILVGEVFNVLGFLALLASVVRSDRRARARP